MVGGIIEEVPNYKDHRIPVNNNHKYAIMNLYV